MFRRVAKVAGAPPLADYTIGQHVQTVEGFPGVINDILEGPADLTTYWVTLDNGQGGGEYAEGEIWPLNQNTASQVAEAVVEHTAAEDYPELSEILSDRLPPQITTSGGKTSRVATSDEASDWNDASAHEDMEGEDYLDPPYPEDIDAARTAAAIPPLSDQAIFRQFDQYPKETTFSGIKYFKGEINDEWHVDCLLCYRNGQLIGVLNHYPQDMGPERKGNVLVMVHPDFRRQGIGAALWAEAKKRWNVKGAGQDQTPSGSAFLKAVDASAQGVADRLALFLPPVPPGDSQPRTEVVDPAQQSGYDEGFSQGKEGITRSPSQPGDAEFMIGFDLGWAKGVTVLREPVNSWDVDDLLDQQIAGPDSSLNTVMTSLDVRESGVMDLIRGTPLADPNSIYSYDWCRFRRSSHCYLPKTLNEVASKEAGYAVWNPEDRGHCGRTTWDSQKICPTGEPGPHTDNGFTDATVPWDEGGQRGGVPSGLYRSPTASVDLGLPAMPKHADRSISDEWDSLEVEAARGDLQVEATWADVRAKAKRIRSEGGVRIVASKDNILTAHVRGDHGVYETELVRFPGKDNIATWQCGCKWSSYSWGRSGRWKKFEGRVCAHALALQYEAQARNMFGKTLTLDEKQPSWMDGKHVHTPNSYDRTKHRYTHLVTSGFRDDLEYRSGKPSGDFPEGEHRLTAYLDGVEVGHIDFDAWRETQVLVLQMTVDPRFRRQGIGAAMLDRLRRQYEEANFSVEDFIGNGEATWNKVFGSLLTEASVSKTFLAKVRGMIRSLFISDSGDIKDSQSGEIVVPGQVLYPGYHPTLGLNPHDTGRVR